MPHTKHNLAVIHATRPGHHADPGPTPPGKPPGTDGPHAAERDRQARRGNPAYGTLNLDHLTSPRVRKGAGR